MKTRECECLRCNHKWTAEVVLSKFTANLSGERTNWCPKCGTKETLSEPINDSQNSANVRVV